MAKFNEPENIDEPVPADTMKLVKAEICFSDTDVDYNQTFFAAILSYRRKGTPDNEGDWVRFVIPLS